MGNSVKIVHIKQKMTEKQQSLLSSMGTDDLCFYRFVGGNSNETAELYKNLQLLKRRKVTVIGFFRFPFRFEGKKRQQTAVEQYYLLKQASDAITYFLSDGMLDLLDAGTTLKEAANVFAMLEETPILALEKMILRTGDMNIDVKDLQSFLGGSRGPFFIHTIEEDFFDEPLKYLMAIPYLPHDYADGDQMLIQMNCSDNVDMDEFRQVNLRLHDLFHKAELFKLGTEVVTDAPTRFKITVLVNGLKDPFQRPEPTQQHVLERVLMKGKWWGSMKKNPMMVPFLKE
ncbi:cell division protein FtsZ [Bacillus timonensis]|nr:cell division protein FtsZ [Bacillus timonensis]